MAMLLAYDATGAVVATLDYCVAQDEAGDVVGMVDFEAHEVGGGALTDIWQVSNATGSGTWPEFLGGRAREFTVERGSDGRISALVHKTSGHRRERAAIEAAIATQRAATVPGQPVNLRHIVGGPQRPLKLDTAGRS